MEIIERGKCWRDVECYGCQSRLRVDLDDLIPNVQRNSEGLPERAFSVKCAVCFVKVAIRRPPVEVLEEFDTLNE